MHFLVLLPLPLHPLCITVCAFVCKINVCCLSQIHTDCFFLLVYPQHQDTSVHCNTCIYKFPCRICVHILIYNVRFPMQVVLYIKKQIVGSKMQRKWLKKDNNLKADRTYTFQDFLGRSQRAIQHLFLKALWNINGSRRDFFSCNKKVTKD